MNESTKSKVDAAMQDDDDIDALIEQAESDAVAAEEAAASALARAARLHRLAQDTDADEAAGPESDVGTDEQSRGRRRFRRLRPSVRALAVAGALLLVCALLAASGLIVRQHQQAQASDRAKAEYAAAARQVVVTLMSIDFTKPQEAVNRIVDNSTGAFRDEFSMAADDFIRVAKDAKVTTNATAEAAAVQSMTDNSAVVLVAASSTVTNEAGAVDDPRSWRLTVDLQREGDRIKMSKVEFVP